MEISERKNSIKRDARLAGFLYLLLVPLGFFGIATSTVPAGPEEVVSTANDILASETMYRLSIVSALLVPIVNVFVVFALYRVLKPVNKKMASLMVIFILLVAPIAMLNELNRFAALLLLSDTGYLTGFTTEQLQSLAPLFLELHQYGIAIAGIFWGLWLFPMGYLVFRSTFIPRIIGVLLIIACFGYLIDSFAKFLLSDSTVDIAIYTFWGELFLLLWLLIKGVNVEKWEKIALESG